MASRGGWRFVEFAVAIRFPSLFFILIMLNLVGCVFDDSVVLSNSSSLYTLFSQIRVS